MTSLHLTLSNEWKAVLNETVMCNLHPHEEHTSLAVLPVVNMISEIASSRAVLYLRQSSVGLFMRLRRSGNAEKLVKACFRDLKPGSSLQMTN